MGAKGSVEAAKYNAQQWNNMEVCKKKKSNTFLRLCDLKIKLFQISSYKG